MRITGGKARGIRLRVPPGRQVRPATDAIREAVFASLGEICNDAQVLDLFAGSGSYGLECISRGATQLCSVENDKKAADALRTNLEAVQHSMQRRVDFRLLTQNAYKLPQAPATFDLIFVDPPYADFEHEALRLIEQLHSCLKPSPHSRVIIELPAEVELHETRSLSCMRKLGGKKKHAPSIRIMELKKK